ncbi:hypothetical protein SBA3_1420008 [Candidatus Sulfopaludibacter sp. SbA3]|nr:hypothetical protein SBA3_1420008 [Candidatus Sulfopaludibacter sp. SbA3]
MILKGELRLESGPERERKTRENEPADYINNPRFVYKSDTARS